MSRLLACVDIDLGCASAQAASHGVPHSADLATVLEMPDVELIINLTIPAVHASVALQAIRSGKHVYGEKPFALSIEEARRSSRRLLSTSPLGQCPTPSWVPACRRHAE